MRLLIGTDSEQAAVIRAAHELHTLDPSAPLLVLLGATDGFSFRPRPSTILVPAMPAGVIAAEPSLEEFGIASRLASEVGLPGCYDGPVLELAREWLLALDSAARVEITVAGDEGLMRSAEELGRSLNIRVGGLKRKAV